MGNVCRADTCRVSSEEPDFHCVLDLLVMVAVGAEEMYFHIGW